VSIVDLFEGALEVRASSGESFLGGEDFTRALAARVLQSMGLTFERAEMDTPQLVSRLLQQCELAKRQLSKDSTALIRVPEPDGQLKEATPPRQVSREQYETWTERILARVELPIRRCLGDAKLKLDDLDEVILVGGATRSPRFIERVRQMFGRDPHCRMNPDEVVALGAAVQAGLIGRDASVSDMVVTDVAPFTLGIDIAKKLGLEQRPGYFMPIIHRNTTIPVSRVERVETLSANQTQVVVKVYQGESRKVEQNQLLGEFAVPGIPRGPAGREVDIRFTYDLNGVLEIEATIVATKKSVTHVITRMAHHMDEAAIQKAISAMQELKHHPREDSANRLSLRRAERLYRELPTVERQVLADLLDGFEGAMELSDKRLIEAHRQELDEFLNHYEQGFESFGGPESEDAD
jgi:molecular chaperone HscC